MTGLFASKATFANENGPGLSFEPKQGAQTVTDMLMFSAYYYRLENPATDYYLSRIYPAAANP